LSTATAIRQARERKGFSMSKLARLVGVTRPCVYLWENGQTRPRPRHAERLEALLGLEAGSLNHEAAAPPRTAAHTPYVN
jgi:predicted transcriptional regulator